eukprot:scaffold23938_cov31-Tisochrysis_lutea.AAC.2
MERGDSSWRYTSSEAHASNAAYSSCNTITQEGRGGAISESTCCELLGGGRPGRARGAAWSVFVLLPVRGRVVRLPNWNIGSHVVFAIACQALARTTPLGSKGDVRGGARARQVERDLVGRHIALQNPLAA